MNERISAASSPGEIRVAVMRDDVLVEYAIWRPGAPDGVGDVYRGRVLAKVPAMGGCFVVLDGSEGFLPDSDGGAALHEGDIVAVRITRAPQGGKGPRLTIAESSDQRMGLLARGPGPLIELAQRHPDARIFIDDGALAATLKPGLRDRIVVAERVFDAAIEEQVAMLAEPGVEVNGGRLHIDPTPALVAIDVDAGRAVSGRSNKSAAHLAANRAMLPELARQIRLRNLSGAILVDFAGLPTRRRAGLAGNLRAALADDPLQPRLLGFTALGLAEIVRPRVHPPLHELLAGPHAAGLAALRQLAALVALPPHRLPVLRASPAIVAALEIDPMALADLARRAGRSLILRADPSLAATAWTIETDD